MANYCYKVMFATLVLGLIAFLIVNVRQHVLAQGQWKLVRTLTGPVRGERRLGTLIDQSRPYYAFRGIPYAEPPIENMRFRPARPIGSWKPVRSCYRHEPVCMQLNGKRELIGSEDCLYLNVYTPDVDPPAEQLRAVLVWLPGDDWFSGSGNVDQLGPEFLVEQDLVVVTVNYRLGVLGFLNLDVPEVPGNQGLGDQQLALEWIYENVQRFGGDPKRLTLGGAGAGAMASQLHTFAERSALLFGRTVQLGTAFGAWGAFERPPVATLRAELLRLVRELQKRRVNNVDLVNELQAIDAGDLVEAMSARNAHWLGPSSELATAGAAEFPFLREAYDWRLEQPAGRNWTTNKDVLAGYGTAEAFAMAAATFDVFRQNASAVALPSAIRWRAPGAQSAWQRIAQRYFANGTEQSSRAEYTRLLSDVHQRYLVDRRLRYMAGRSGGRVFRYAFDVDGQLNAAKHWAFRGEFAVAGAAHGDELCYVFRCEGLTGMYANVTSASPAYRNIMAMSGAVAQFVKTGAPDVPQWTPIAATDDDVSMRLTDDGWRAERSEFDEERRFWSGLIEE